LNQPADEVADRTADQAEHRRFDEELKEDVALPCADRFADPDLAGALGHRDEHDVHDADPADQQRDRGDSAEKQGQGVGHFGDRGQQILLIRHSKIVGAFVGVVALAEHKRDLFDCRIDYVAVLGLDVYAVLGLDVYRTEHIGAAVPPTAKQTGLGCRDGNQHLIIDAAQPRAALAFENANHRIWLAVDPHLLADCAGRAAEEILSDATSQHDDR